MADKTLYSLLIDLRADTAMLQQDMKKAVNILSQSGSTISNITKGIGQGIGIAFGQGAVSAVGRLSTALIDLADKGDKVSAVIDNFQKLGGSSTALKQAQQAVLGTVSAFDLMRAANEGLVRGIPNLNQNLAKLAEFANRFADATGQETVPVLNELITAIGSGSEKALKGFGFQLQEGATKAENMATAMSQVPQVMERLAPLGVSVTSGFESLARALSDAATEMGRGINESEGFARTLNLVADAIDRIDWNQFGQDIANAMNSITSPINKMIVGVELAINSLESLRVKVLEFDAMKPPLVSASDALGFDLPGVSNGRKRWQEKQAIVQKERNRVDSDRMSILMKPLLEGLVSTIKTKTPPNTTPPQAADGGGRGNGGGGGGGGSSSNSAAQAARELAQTQSQFRSFLETDVRNALSDSIKNVDQAAFDSLKEKLRTSLEQSYIESNQKFVDAKLMSMDELTAKAKQSAAAEVEEYSNRMKDAYQDRAQQEKRLAEEQIRAAEEVARIHKQAVDSWRGFWDRMFSGEAIDYKQSLKELATGFASELSAGLFGELKGGADIFFTLGQTIAAGLGNGVGKMGGGSSSSYASMVNSVGNYFGGSGSYQGTMTTDQAHAAGYQGPGMADGSFGGSSAMTTDQAHAQGIQGPGGADGSFNSGSQGASQGANYAGYVQAGATTINAVVNARDIDKKNRDNSGTGGAVGAGAGAIIGGIFGGPMGSAIGSQIGNAIGSVVGSFIKRGPQNKNTIARHTFANWMEDFFAKERFVVSDRNNQSMSPIKNFVEGPTTRFNNSDWSDEMKQQSKEAQSAFKGLAAAMKEILGITEDIGDEMAFLLGKNLEWNVNNARHLFKQMRMSVEEIEDKLVEAGRQGKMTWLEVETAIQGVHEANKPGLVEAGGYDIAFGNLLKSGGKGFEAIQSVRDLGVELQEAEVKTFEQMQALLLQKGFDDKSISALIEALKQRGVMSPEDLANVTDRVAGGIVADMAARGASFADLSKEVSDAMGSAIGPLNEAASAVRELSATLRETGGLVQKSASEDEPIDGYAAGGVVFGPKKGLMGENGPEAILPLTRRNGKMGVSFHGVGSSGGGYVVNIDARGAGPGVEGRIRSAMREAEDRAVRRIMRATRYSQGRTN